MKKNVTPAFLLLLLITLTTVHIKAQNTDKGLYPHTEYPDEGDEYRHGGEDCRSQSQPLAVIRARFDALWRSDNL